MNPPPARILFGVELRRRRLGEGLSLAGLARLVHYSKSHLSKVETGSKPPSVDLARRCDAALSCGGALAGLVTRPPVGGQVAGSIEPGEVWVMNLDATGDDRFAAVSRRDLLTGGLAGMMLWAGPGSGARVEPGGTILETFRAMLDQLRRLGQQLGPATLLPILTTQTHALRRLAVRVDPPGRSEAYRLGARFAEYAGWMAQESGADDQALWWTDRAVELANAGGDRDLVAYAYVRRALVTLYRHDPAQTVELADRASAGTRSPRVLGLAAQRIAQGHALAGDATRCLRALERAEALLALPAEEDGPVLGSSHVANPAALVRGWCDYDLGRPGLAAEHLRRELAGVPESATRVRARFGIRLALAYADSGELEQAGEVLTPLLPGLAQIDSATVRADLRALARSVNRRHNHPAAEQLRIGVAGLLSGTAFPVA